MILLETFRIHRNWHSVQKLLPHYTLNEIQEHYEYIYLNQQGSKLLPKVPETKASMFPEPIIPYRLKLDDVQDPPRHSPGTFGFNLTAGYNAARSDFEVKFDANAESLVAHLPTICSSSPEFPLFSELHCSIIQIYNRRLLERQRRRRIIREHGLIVPRKTATWLHRYDQTLTHSVYDRLARYMQFYTGEGFEYMMEGLHRAGELKMQIAR